MRKVTWLKEELEVLRRLVLGVGVSVLPTRTIYGRQVEDPYILGTLVDIKLVRILNNFINVKGIKLSKVDGLYQLEGYQESKYFEEGVQLLLGE